MSDGSGKPIRGATVVARNPDATPSAYSTTTDDRGRWVVIGLKSGTWTFTASAPGFRAQTDGGRIGSAGTNPHFEFRLERSGEPVEATSSASRGGAHADLAAADALVRAGRLDEAVEAYETIASRGKSRPEVAVRLGRAFRLKRDFDRAVTVLRSVAPDSSAAAEAAQELGLTLFEKGDLDEADRVLTDAAAARGAGRDIFYALGEVKLAKAQTADAVTWYERAVDADPAWPRPLLKLGLVAANDGDRSRAEAYFRRVMAIAPDSLEARQARTLLAQMR